MDVNLAVKHGFDFGLESRIAEGLLLLDMGADVGHGVVADGSLEQRTVSGSVVARLPCGASTL